MAPPDADSPGRHVLLYDGVCGLCDRVVRFVVPRDPSGIFRYEPLQGAWAREALVRHRRSPDALDTFVVVRDAGRAREDVLDRRRATVFVLSRLTFPWRLLSALALVPGPILDAAYDRLARVRYRLFGRLDACSIEDRVPRSRDPQP